jgi:hypothetical protein
MLTISAEYDSQEKMSAFSTLRRGPMADTQYNKKNKQTNKQTNKQKNKQTKTNKQTNKTIPNCKSRPSQNSNYATHLSIH